MHPVHLDSYDVINVIWKREYNRSIKYEQLISLNHNLKLASHVVKAPLTTKFLITPKVVKFGIIEIKTVFNAQKGRQYH